MLTELQHGINIAGVFLFDCRRIQPPRSTRVIHIFIRIKEPTGRFVLQHARNDDHIGVAVYAVGERLGTADDFQMPVLRCKITLDQSSQRRRHIRIVIANAVRKRFIIRIDHRPAKNIFAVGLNFFHNIFLALIFIEPRRQTIIQIRQQRLRQFSHLLPIVDEDQNFISARKVFAANVDGTFLAPNFEFLAGLAKLRQFFDFNRSIELDDRREIKFIDVLAPIVKRSPHRYHAQPDRIHRLQKNKIRLEPANFVLIERNLIEHKQIVSAQKFIVLGGEHKNFFVDDDRNIGVAAHNSFIVQIVFAGRLHDAEFQAQFVYDCGNLIEFLRRESPIGNGEQHFIILIGGSIALNKITHQCDKSFARARRAHHEQPFVGVMKIFAIESLILQSGEIFKARTLRQ